MSEQEAEGEAVCYYLKDGLLMRKYRRPDVPNEPWEVYHQVVIPGKYKKHVIRLAHSVSASHLGVRKTCHMILTYFFWIGIHKDVSKFCKECHVCQLAGKPNRMEKPVPLRPILAVQEPFTRVVIDCMGPLPRTKSGKEYLLTLMCMTTRYPEAIPVRNIKSKTIVPLIVNYFSKFGMPKEIQSDQGTNFMSKAFSQAMSTLGVKHYVSSAYHPQSQGCLERFHQTLKSMLTKYCMEFQSDWDEGIQIMLYAIRGARQESLGYSPFELMFGRNPRSPL